MSCHPDSSHLHGLIRLAQAPGPDFGVPKSLTMRYRNINHSYRCMRIIKRRLLKLYVINWAVRVLDANEDVQKFVAYRAMPQNRSFLVPLDTDYSEYRQLTNYKTRRPMITTLSSALNPFRSGGPVAVASGIPGGRCQEIPDDCRRVGGRIICRHVQSWL